MGALSNKVGRGQRNREEIGADYYYFSRGFAARSRALRARISRLRRSSARLNKTAMLRRLFQRQIQEFFKKGFASVTEEKVNVPRARNEFLMEFDALSPRTRSTVYKTTIVDSCLSLF